MRFDDDENALVWTGPYCNFVLVPLKKTRWSWSIVITCFLVVFLFVFMTNPLNLLFCTDRQYCLNVIFYPKRSQSWELNFQTVGLEQRQHTCTSVNCNLPRGRVAGLKRRWRFVSCSRPRLMWDAKVIYTRSSSSYLRRVYLRTTKRLCHIWRFACYLRRVLFYFV